MDNYRGRTPHKKSLELKHNTIVTNYIQFTVKRI